MPESDKGLPPAPRPYFLINNLQVAMMQRLEKDLRALGVTPAAGRVLNAIARRPQISSSDLARMFGISPQSIKETISVLENAQLIERFPSETDRRVLRARLTSKGWEVRNKHLDALADMYRDVFRGLNELEMTMLVALLKKALATARPEALEYYIDARGGDGDQAQPSVDEF